MSATVGARQHSNTVVCVWNEVRYCDVELRGVATVMEDAGFWEADLIAVDFSIGNKRMRPCDLKQNVLDLSSGLFILNILNMY